MDHKEGKKERTKEKGKKESVDVFRVRNIYQK